MPHSALHTVPILIFSMVLATSLSTARSSYSGRREQTQERPGSSPGLKTFVWGGRIHIDATTYTYYSTIAPAQMMSPIIDVRLRRLRLYTKGRLSSVPIHWKFQLEFAGGRVRPRTIFIQYSFGSSLHIRAGQMKEPIGLERLTSSNHITFIERSLPTQVQPDRNLGIALHATKHFRSLAMGIQGGVFLPGSRSGHFRTDTTPALAATLRLAGLVPHAYGWVQTAVAYSYRPVPQGLFAVPDWQPEIHRASLPAPPDMNPRLTSVAQTNLLTWDFYIQIRNLFLYSEITGFVADPGFSHTQQSNPSSSVQASAFATTLHIGYAFHLMRTPPASPVQGLPGFRPANRAIGFILAARFSYGEIHVQPYASPSATNLLWATTGALTLYFSKNARLSLNYTFGKKHTTVFHGLLLRAQLTFQQKTKTPNNP